MYIFNIDPSDLSWSGKHCKGKQILLSNVEYLRQVVITLLIKVDYAELDVF